MKHKRQVKISQSKSPLIYVFISMFFTDDETDVNKFASISCIKGLTVEDVIKEGVNRFQTGGYEYILNQYNSKSKKALIEDVGALRHTLKRLKKSVKKDARFLYNAQWLEAGFNGMHCFEVLYFKLVGFLGSSAKS